MGARRGVIPWVAGLGLALCALGPAGAGAVGAGFVVLVNQANPVASISRSELKRLATGETKQWSSGAVVHLGIIPSDAPETKYLASLFDMSTRELLARIQEQVFKGELRRPAVLRSSTDCVAFARSSAGALCIASGDEPVPPEAHVVVLH
ncbi:MAG TPA: hypothetical protein VE987_01745 [Polyangiaceae bacterium]|nr:hypothetical protein [Polyangiaceae bacterium]